MRDNDYMTLADQLIATGEAKAKRLKRGKFYTPIEITGAHAIMLLSYETDEQRIAAKRWKFLFWAYLAAYLVGFACAFKDNILALMGF